MIEAPLTWLNHGVNPRALWLALSSCPLAAPSSATGCALHVIGEESWEERFLHWVPMVEL